MSRTLVLLKPDAVEQELGAEIVGRFVRAGLKIEARKKFKFDRQLLGEHYAHLVTRSFWPDVEEYMLSGPCVAMIVSGKDAVERVRDIAGPTDPRKAPHTTLRGRFGVAPEGGIMKNVLHASDSDEAAREEIERFFPEFP